MNRIVISLISLLSFHLSPYLNAEVVTIESKSGKTMIVSLVSKQGDKVVIKRASDNKEFTISPDSLSDESKKLLLEKMKTLKEAYPPLEASVTIGKRRKADNDSYYMKKMTITSKVTLENTDRDIPCPTCTMNIIFIGQSQKNTDEYLVLSNQAFEVKPTLKGITKETAPFATSYDSDNKGEGNIGGYKYIGYLVVVTGSDKEIILTKTISSVIKKALEIDASTAERIKSFPQNTKIGKDMKKAKISQVIRRL